MKIVLIGDSSVGKTALVYRFIHNRPVADSKATVGIAFFKQNIVDSETGEDYTLQIWDTAGQEKFQSVTTHHYRAADGALLVFDISSEASFLHLDKWLAELRENTDPNLVVALVGTKVDLSHRRMVPFERAQAYAKAHGLLYMETSSLWDKYQGNGKDAVAGVERVFLRVLRAIVQQQRDVGRHPGRLDISGYGEANHGKDAIHLGGEARGRQSGGAGGGCEC
mmetsp:Transcript_66941/g.187106  ORF Transcript_66941/g.187106 Transcript_66941/m.187106 type:complete len:223 (+) Transcript_66941:84-752(+)